MNHFSDQRKKLPELLAPAGSFACLRTALKAGCGAVYFGVEHLNMRSRSLNNFSIEDLKKIVDLCGGRGVESYLALNTLLFDHDLMMARKIIDSAEKAGITALICSDMAAILYARKKGLRVHISTQLSVSNIEAVKFFARYADTIVLARELTLPMIRKICQQVKERDIRGPGGELVKIEIFCHGAICVSESGRCAMSLLSNNASANRGACLQPCRRKYEVKDLDSGNILHLDNQYVMSPQDLCTIGMLDNIVESGVSILKIEGRARGPEYVSQVVRVYREALNAIKKGTYTQEKIKDWNKRLGTVFNRGLSDHFYRGRKLIEWSGVYGSRATEKKIYLGEVARYYPRIRVAEIKIKNDVYSLGEFYLITGPRTGLVKGRASEIWLDGKKVAKAGKGEVITFRVPESVRSGDEFYKMVKIKGNIFARGF